jgi:hypothetical protein
LDLFVLSGAIPPVFMAVAVEASGQLLLAQIVLANVRFT